MVHHGIQLSLARILERVLILGAAHGIVYGQILYRLHIQPDALHLGQLWSQPLDQLGCGNVALGKRLQRDLDAPAIQRSVRSVGTDER